jgi:hypothetical protein
MRSASAKPRVIDERRALALALEQRVGGDRRAHLHGVDRAVGNRRARREPSSSRMPCTAASS